MRLYAVAIKYFTVALNICGSSVRNMLHVPLRRGDQIFYSGAEYLWVFSKEHASCYRNDVCNFELARRFL